MFFVYILESEFVERYYVGSAEDVNERLEVHNGSKAKWTKRYQPWDIVHTESFETRGEAVKRERALKRLKNIGRYLDKIRRREM